MTSASGTIFIFLTICFTKVWDANKYGAQYSVTKMLVSNILIICSLVTLV